MSTDAASITKPQKARPRPQMPPLADQSGDLLQEALRRAAAQAGGVVGQWLAAMASDEAEAGRSAPTKT